MQYYFEMKNFIFFKYFHISFKQNIGKSFGFTLAEVLITLGIIGVVAALTIPNLMQQKAKQETVAKLQKLYSTVSQAHKNAELELGSSKTWDIPTSEWNGSASNDWWNKHFIPYANLSVIKTCSTTHNECWATNATYLDGTAASFNNNMYYLLLKDGTALSLWYVGNSYAHLFVDVNGPKKPNVVGKDIFLINVLYKEGAVQFNGKGMSRTNLLINGDYRCEKSTGNSKGDVCGALIQQDGWKIADDYPWN